MREKWFTARGADSYSTWHGADHGVLQRFVLGPLLFLICHVMTFPFVLCGWPEALAMVREPDKRKQLEDLDALYRWSEKWQLSMNHEKCAHIQVGLQRTRDIHRSSATIENVIWGGGYSFVEDPSPHQKSLWLRIGHAGC